MIDMDIETEMGNEPHPAEKAFLDARTGFELFGQPLKPYTPSRKVAAQSMGMLYPFVGEEGQEQMARTGVYPGQLKDVIILLWLCSLQDPLELTADDIRAGKWTPTRANQAPAKAYKAAEDWAASKQITDTLTPTSREAFQVFMAIVSGVAAGEFRLALEGDQSSEPEGENPNV